MEITQIIYVKMSISSVLYENTKKISHIVVIIVIISQL